MGFKSPLLLRNVFVLCFSHNDQPGKEIIKWNSSFLSKCFLICSLWVLSLLYFIDRMYWIFDRGRQWKRKKIPLQTVVSIFSWCKDLPPKTLKSFLNCDEVSRKVYTYIHTCRRCVRSYRSGVKKWCSLVNGQNRAHTLHTFKTPYNTIKSKKEVKYLG